MWRHLGSCAARKAKLKNAEQQTKLNFQPTDEVFPIVPPLHSGKFNTEKNEGGSCTLDLDARVSFHHVGVKGFQPYDEVWIFEVAKISRRTAKKDCAQVYELEKKEAKEHVEMYEKLA